MNEKKKNLKPAKTLDEVFDNLSQEPLIERDEFEAFYRGEINSVRGEDKMARLRYDLDLSFKSAYYKGLIVGHSGVGKSTELTKLIFLIENKFQDIRFNATTELDPVNFRPFDVLLLIMVKVAERTSQILKEKFIFKKLSDSFLNDVWNWFSQETVVREEALRFAGGVESGVGAGGESLWAKIYGLFAHLKGEIRFASDRNKKTVEYRLTRISTLIELANRLLDECNELLWKANNKEWLIVGEDFDKPGIPPGRVEEFFITYSNILRDLRTHIIATIPVTLAYSQQASLLPVPSNRKFTIPDTPVFDRNHKSYKRGQDTIRKIIQARIEPSLFTKGQITRLIVASGGNLRDLFSLIHESTLNANLRQAKSIGKEDVTTSVNNLRIEYKRRLGESPYDKIPIHFDEKAKRLIQIYDGVKEMEITDPVLHSLLRARAVQEFNGEGWFGVHPLVVDLLKSFDRLPTGESGRVPGGAD